MRILGVDCGAVKTGYGIIDTDGRDHRLVAAGVIRLKPGAPLRTRLEEIACALRRLIGEHRPHAAAVEGVFYARNVKTALHLAHVRGVVLLAISEARLDFGEYSPLEIKTSVVGYGRAEKHQVQMMIHSLLGLQAVISSEDACDALAVAVCHATHAAAAARLDRPAS